MTDKEAIGVLIDLLADAKYRLDCEPDEDLWRCDVEALTRAIVALKAKETLDKGCECCRDYDLFVGYDLGGGSELGVFVDPENRAIDIRLWDDEQKIRAVDDSRVCNYCPNCGRKLGSKVV